MQVLPGDPSWLVEGSKDLGFHELPGNRGIQKFVDQAHCGAEGESWCAIWANAKLETTGHRGTRNAMARSFEHDANFAKLSEPKRGCITTFWRGSPSSGSGHVTFCTEIDQGKIRGMGGNQNDGVCEGWFSTAHSTGFWWPKDSASPPSASLPPLAGSGASGDTEYDQMQAGYTKLWLEATVRPSFAAEAQKIADSLTAGKDRYAALAAQFGAMPWWVPALLNQMESGVPFKGHLFNGDPLTQYTTHVPAQQPKDVGHGPPFTWEESAHSAIKHDGLDKVTLWTPPMMCFQAECHYNGRGYFKHNVNSPYVWCGTSQYGDPPNVGKFVSDGVWDGSYISKQIGVATIMKTMGIDIVLPDITTPDPTVSTTTLGDILKKIFGNIKWGQDGTAIIHKAVDTLFGGDVVGGLNKLFPSHRSTT